MTQSTINPQATRPSALGQYASVNGLELYYEIHGTGDPLVLVHGGLGSIDMYTGLLPVLAAGRQVIAVELQAHGHTADIDRPLAFESLADDIAALSPPPRPEPGRRPAAIPSAAAWPCKPPFATPPWCGSWWSSRRPSGRTAGTPRSARA
jgi:hypothetical protein